VFDWISSMFKIDVTSAEDAEYSEYDTAPAHSALSAHESLSFHTFPIHEI
jgi:hypothetical protein